MSLAEPKKTKDWSAEIAEETPLIVSAAESDKAQLAPSLEKLLLWEKKCRLAADSSSSIVVCGHILHICVHHQDWAALNDHVSLLCRRHAQLKKTITHVVRESIKLLDKMTDEPTRLQLIETIRTVSAGKIFVELDRARLTKRLADIQEQNGDQKQACKTLMELQVETIGSMELKEKATLLVEQLRLNMATKDWVRAEITKRKINTKKLAADENLHDLKLAFYDLALVFYKNKGEFLEIAKAHRAVFDTPQVQKDPNLSQKAFKSAVIFLVLAPFDYDKQEMLTRWKTEKILEDMPTERHILDALTTDELISWKSEDEFGCAVATWKQDDAFTEEAPKNRWDALHNSVIQHNLRVIAGYYTSVGCGRLADLLQLSEDETETHLSKMVQNKQLTCKMDRPGRVVVFGDKLDVSAQMNSWSSDVSSLLSSVQHVTHLIQKENMMHLRKK